MKTLLSINNYHYRRGGADAVYLDQASLFAEAGWATPCFAMHHPDNLRSDYEEFFVDEIEFGRDYGLLDKIRKTAKIIYSREARQKLARLLEKFSPDVAHVHSVYHHVSPSVLPLLQDKGIPVVLTAHDLKLLCPSYTMLAHGEVCERCCGGAVWNAAIHRCIKDSAMLSSAIALESGIHRLLKIYRNNVDRIVTPSHFYRDKFAQYGWDETKLVYVPNYVDVESFETHFEPGDYFVYAGRLSREKGIATLVEAAAKAAVRLVVVGDGPPRKNLEETAANAGAAIEFTGYQSGAALRQWIRESRALVLPSQWYENAPISILEAYASGKPVVGARIGGIPELIVPDESGWLFESGSVDNLSAVLRQVDSATSSSIADMGRGARRLVEQRHSPSHYLAALSSVYADLGVH